MEAEINLTNIEIDTILKEMNLENEDIQNKTVLLIDDDKWIHRVLVKYLGSWGFSPVSAYDGFEGVAAAIKVCPRIILLDIVMPDIRGDIILKILKRIEITSNIPVIILSGNLDVEIFGTTFKSGAAGFISKPVKEVVLLRKIREIMLPESLFNLKI